MQLLLTMCFTSGMAYKDSGILFGREKQKPQQPDFTGRAQIECPHCHVEKEWDVAGWTKENDKGKFYTLKFQPKGEYQAQHPKKGNEPFPWEQ